MILLLLLFIPVVFALFFMIFSKSNITLKEFILQIVIQLLITSAALGVVYFSNVSDKETWNGRISDKRSVKVSCEHSYSCNCREECSGSGKNRSCHRVCQTCYDHFYDVDWRLYTSNNESINISRIDRQGLRTPPRWNSTKIGEPTAILHHYTNYIKASQDSLFVHKGLVEKYKNILPDYPNKVFDYYRLNRIVQVGYSLPQGFEEKLSDINATLGKQKQANIIIVLTSKLSQDYFYALEQHWLGGKKNDIVVVVNIDDGIITWSSIMGWVKDEIFKVKLRDDIISLNKFDMDAVLHLTQDNTSKLYIRKPMKDFEYLKSSITPSKTAFIVVLIISIISSLGLSYLFYKMEVL